MFSNIRLGSGAYAPLTPEGRCDVIVALEPSEALRYISYLSKSGTVLLNLKKVIPTTVFLGICGYPGLEKIIAKLNQVSRKVVLLDAAQIAEEAGSPQSANIAMLGALFGTGLMPVKAETAKSVIQARFSAKIARLNIRTFELGYQRV